MEVMRARGIYCEMKDTLQFYNEIMSKMVSGAYVGMTIRAPILFRGMYKTWDMMNQKMAPSPVYYANAGYAGRLARYIRIGGYDSVICTHTFPAEALTYLRSKGRIEIPCHAVMTDYTCSLFWDETQMDSYFIPHRDLTDEFTGKGIPASRIVPTGIPVSGRFSIKTQKAEARRALGLDEKQHMLLIMTGSMGFGHTLTLIDDLKHTGAHLCVLTGRNKKLHQQVVSLYGMYENVAAIPYTDQVPLYMDACDVLLTKPGGISISEAATKNVPMVLTEPIPGWETCNAAFFEGHGMAVCCKEPGEAAQKAVALMYDAERRERMASRQREEINPNAARDIIDSVMEYAKRGN